MKKDKDKENKIKEFESKINKINQNSINLKNENNELIKNVSELKNNMEKSILIDSTIVNSLELIFINEGIKKNIKKIVKNYTLIFRASRDGFGANNFHLKCDGKTFTITFVMSEKGKRFGGFTELAWDSSGGYKYSSKGFIFSLDNQEIYYSKIYSNDPNDSEFNKYHGIYCSINQGPSFGFGHDFYLSDNCNLNDKSYNNTNCSYDTHGKKLL